MTTTEAETTLTEYFTEQQRAVASLDTQVRTLRDRFESFQSVLRSYGRAESNISGFKRDIDQIKASIEAQQRKLAYYESVSLRLTHLTFIGRIVWLLTGFLPELPK